MRLALHVGVHKSGTSLIQHYFRDRLAPRRTPRVAVIPRHETNELIGMGGPLLRDPMRLRYRLEAERRTKPAALLVSHENTMGPPFVPGTPGLYPRATEIATALAEITSGFDTTLLLYLRPIPDFVESYYLQTVHQGSVLRFDEWFGQIDANALSWRTLVGSLLTAFGPDLAIGDFREILEGQVPYLRRFMQRSRIPEPRFLTYRKRANPSISAQGLAIALERNQHLESAVDRKWSRQELQGSYSNLTGQRPALLTAAQRADLTAHTEEEYEELVSEHSGSGRA